jgi:hypothetical protein
MATQNLGTAGTISSTSTLSGADAILKEYYPSAIVEQLNYKTFMLDQIDRDAEHIDFTGRRAIIPLHRARNRGRNSFADGGILPQAGKQDWTDAVVPIKYHAAAIELSDQAIQQTKSNEGAFVSLLEAETKGVAKDLRKDINRQVFGLGDGTLATVSAYSAPTLTCKTSNDAVGVQYLQVGDCVDVVSSDGATVRVTGAFVTARTPAAATATVTLATTQGGSTNVTVTGSIVSGDKVVLATGFGQNSYGLEMDGLRNIAGSTSGYLHSINRGSAANAFFRPSVNAINGSVTETAMMQLADTVAQTGQGEVDTFLTTRGIRRAMIGFFNSTKRFNDSKAVELHGGYTAIMVNEIPVVIDDDCPKGWLFAFNKKAFKWFELAKPGFLEQDGGIFTLKDGLTSTNSAYGSKAAIWQAYFRWYAAFGCVQPNLTGALTGLTGDDDPA